MNSPRKVSISRRSPLAWFLVVLVLIAALTAIGPAEKTLGVNARVVYLHGVWVWASLAGFVAAALAGVVGLLLQRQGLHAWSRALGRAGLFFWLTYIPISLWAMQASWNGLFLAEPRFRLAVVFAVVGLLLQVGVTLMEDPAWASAGNIGFLVALFVSLATTQNVMHPPAPILASNAWRIQVFFGGLLLLTLVEVWLVARWLHSQDQPAANTR